MIAVLSPEQAINSGRVAKWRKRTKVGATILGLISAALIAIIPNQKTTFADATGATVPIDAENATGHGLNPHILPENTLAQATSIAVLRGVDMAKLRCMIDTAIKGRFLSLCGSCV